MHKADSLDPNSARAVSQAEADRCCAASEGDQSSQTSSTFASSMSLAVLGTPTLLPAAPAVDIGAARSAVLRLPPSHVSKHVLHSVFLV